MKNLSVEEWKNESIDNPNAVILDVRTKDEFDEAFIPDAKLIDIQNPANFTSSVEELDKEKNYYIYCRSGQRSTMACQVMENMGFTKVNNLDGGILAWDGPIETK
ncbi:MAG: rhodanese-like domain-containing protein [Bacteroidota bacterium]